MRGLKLFTVLFVTFFALPAFAAEGSSGLNAISAALAISIAAFGGALGQGRAHGLSQGLLSGPENDPPQDSAQLGFVPVGQPAGRVLVRAAGQDVQGNDPGTDRAVDQRMPLPVHQGAQLLGQTGFAQSEAAQPSHNHTSAQTRGS